ncbi:MAG: aminoglycoside 3'-phosphotransferase [Oscillospiraceae bacterium]|jgi:kanamycin kinase|nr:aminoglycoside 3'-phosphotransferase [Oscillospiraceae bacterium]
MTLTPIEPNIDDYPAELHPVLSGAKLFDSSCSPEAKVIFIDKNGGYFLKSAPKGSLEREATMTRYFHNKGLAADVLTYISNEHDWLLTEKIYGDDCTAAKYLEQPERLAETLGERLALLHSLDYADCPVQDHTKRYLEKMECNKRSDIYDKSHFPDSFGYASAKEAWAVVVNHNHLLKTDTLLHGDYCLPNVILDDWRLSGFIDLDNSGVGDRHVDIFWGAWTLWFNLKTEKYRQRFFDAYGRERIDEEVLRVVAACEVFG